MLNTMNSLLPSTQHTTRPNYTFTRLQHQHTRLQYHINISMNFISFNTLQQQPNTTQHAHTCTAILTSSHITSYFHNLLSFLHFSTYKNHSQHMKNKVGPHLFLASPTRLGLPLTKRKIFFFQQSPHVEEDLLISKKARKK